jgi:predicted metal-binding membrane protein
MESARLPRPVGLRASVQLGLVFGLLLLTAIAWAITDERMGGMDAGPGTAPGELGFWIVAWIVMMAAMMFPSIYPMVFMFARIQEGKRRRGDAVRAGVMELFVGGYLVAWAGAGLLAYAVVEVGRAIDPAFLAWDRAGPYVAGGVIVAAAVYQLTPLKDTCLRHCRNPMTFLLHHWHSGRLGALRMGVEHGGFCVGCCWGLFAALIALGVMSIGWMVFIAALIAAEKLLPWKAAANRGIAILLAVLGLAVAFAPEDVPGLTIPGSPEAMGAMGAMEAMGMEMEGTGEGSMPGMEGGGMGSEPMPGSGGGADGMGGDGR